MTISLADQAYQILEDKIVRLEYQPGALISEKQLSDELGIGRMPIREAIKRLEQAHLIRIMPRRGMMVTEIKLDEILLQTEVRRVLERLIVRRASRYANDEQRSQLMSLADEYEAATVENDANESMRVDNEFNHLVAECAMNPYATASIMPLHALARRLYYFYYGREDALIVKINMAHVNLMKAIANSHEDEAVTLSDHLVDLILELYKKHYFQLLD